MPVMEAISNAMHGIEEKFDEEGSKKGRIAIQFNHPNDPLNLQMSIIDNGIGLTNSNFTSFKTPFSGFKLQKKGRGFGRFIAFKIFDNISYESSYSAKGAFKTRSFIFDIKADQELIHTAQEFDTYESGLRVTYGTPLSDWHELITGMNVDEIADAVAAHFLPYFLYKWLPEITIQFDTAIPQNITRRFKDIFVSTKSDSLETEIDGSLETINYSIARIPRSKQFPHHCLLFAAADRIVGSPRNLSNLIGDSYFVDENDDKYIVIAVVRSEAFETRLNDARTNLMIGAKSVEEIITKVCRVIHDSESIQIQKIKREQAVGLDAALRENPILRLGLRGRAISEYVSSKPNNWRAEQFIQDLAVERYRESTDLSKAIVMASDNEDNYKEKIDEIVSKLDQTKKEALAEYIIHRRSIIDLVQAARRFQLDGSRAPEDRLHDLVFKRFTDNTNHSYFEHNLWLVDDALAFLPYVSSDRTVHGGRRQKGDKVADIAFFDESLILGDEDGTTLTIVEFKRPHRDDYRFGDEKSDPVLQVLSTLEQATAAGGMTKANGEYINFNGVVRRFAYIIADATNSLVKLLKRHDFKNEWNPRIYFRYRDNEQIYIQAIGYDTLIENAKKRNHAFFHVLLGE